MDDGSRIRWAERATGMGAIHLLEFADGGKYYAASGLPGANRVGRKDGWVLYETPVEPWMDADSLRVFHRTNSGAVHTHGVQEPCGYLPVCPVLR